MRVDYDPVTTIFSCTFVNESDLSPKSCSIIYGQCGQERYTDQGNVTDGSSFVITIKLNLSIIGSNYCYNVTASNGTYEIVMNGSRNLPMRDEGESNNAVLSVIVVPIIILVVVIGVISAIVILRQRRRQLHGNQFSFFEIGLM